MADAASCLHLTLTFASGGFHLQCVACGARWKAEVDSELGPSPDYSRVNPILDRQVRVKP